MANTFIQKNKKKSALAALLLFLRTRKTVTALLLLAVLASFLFVSPSNILLALPGGTRLAAGVAWIAGKVGMDTSKWGLAGGKRDYNDLVAAFRAAKDGGGKAGWSAFMQGAAPGAGAGGGSLDFVAGSRKDLEVKGGAGEKLAKSGTVAGVLNPDDAKNRGEGEGVALNEEDIGREREGLVKSAFAGGFSNTSGFSGASNVGATVSGGAYAGAGFFSGAGGASSAKLSDTVKGGLDGVPNPVATKPTAIPGGTHGRLSGPMAAAVNKSISKGMVSQNIVAGQRAFVQLAAGNGRAVLSVGNNCNENNSCPAEFAATNTGVIYDGGKISGDGTGILTTHDQPTPVVPLDTDIPPSADPTKLLECTDKAQACEEDKQPYYKRMSQLQQQLNGWYGQMGNACGDPCDCGPCNNLKNRIKNLCNGELKTVVDKVQAPCNLPSYCAELGVTSPSGAEASATMNMCKMNMGECGCDSIFCDIGCALGS